MSRSLFLPPDIGIISLRLSCFSFLSTSLWVHFGVSPAVCVYFSQLAPHLLRLWAEPSLISSCGLSPFPFCLPPCATTMRPSPSVCCPNLSSPLCVLQAFWSLCDVSLHLFEPLCYSYPLFSVPKWAGSVTSTSYTHRRAEMTFLTPPVL